MKPEVATGRRGRDAQAVRRRRAGVTFPPTDMPWNVREMHLPGWPRVPGRPGIRAQKRETQKLEDVWIGFKLETPMLAFYSRDFRYFASSKGLRQNRLGFSNLTILTISAYSASFYFLWLTFLPILDSMDGKASEAEKILWSGRRGSNPQPPAWEADALPLSYSRSFDRTTILSHT